tara:strand:+ start:84 stop:329 length:246 start_codon:yes stop_codon:yes gene_type:complete
MKIIKTAQYRSLQQDPNVKAEEYAHYIIEQNQLRPMIPTQQIFRELTYHRNSKDDFNDPDFRNLVIEKVNQATQSVPANAF